MRAWEASTRPIQRLVREPQLRRRPARGGTGRAGYEPGMDGATSEAILPRSRGHFRGSMLVAVALTPLIFSLFIGTISGEG